MDALTASAGASSLLPHISTSSVFLPEQNPFETLMVDVTHRCNMECKNCYIPNRSIPDLDADWMMQILERLPSRTHIRLVGAEPTVRKDLPDLIRRVRGAGHLPIVMTNGLKLANRRYVRELKSAGLRTVYLSFNGGFEDDIYEAIDDLRCAKWKLRAYENLCAENMYISLGMILVRGVNEGEFIRVFEDARTRRQVRELHGRSVGAIGRYMATDSFRLEELVDMFASASGTDRDWILAQREHESYVDFRLGRLRLQLTQWPDMGSDRRGRLAPDGTLQPAFEHVAANEGGY